MRVRAAEAVEKVLSWRRGPSQFRRASDGSMTLWEHLQELRSRLFKASIAILLGMIIGWFLAQPAYDFLTQPYCGLELPDWGDECPQLQQLEALAVFRLKLRLALWIGLILAAPIWFYQLWMFIAPGLRSTERKWAYIFVSIAVPLFIGGALLAYTVIDRGLRFLITYGIEGAAVDLEVSGYISFVSTVMLVFAVGMEMPLLVMMLNFAGIVSAQKLLAWWRIAVFIAFVFASFATPDPGPFGMLLLASVLSAMYFIVVGVAFLNDRRKARNQPYADLPDDEISPLDDVADEEEDLEPVTAGEPVESSGPAEGRRTPLDGRYDDIV